MSVTPGSSQDKTWQKRLNSKCKELGISPPWYQPYSDRRGKDRTAWTTHIFLDHWGEISNAMFVEGSNTMFAVRESVAEKALKTIERFPNEMPSRAPRPTPSTQGPSNSIPAPAPASASVSASASAAAGSQRHHANPHVAGT